VDTGGGLSIGCLDEAEDLAGLLVDPVVLVVHAVLALDADVRLVGSDHVRGLHAEQVVDVKECRHE
jgi:hypothetical protein